ncbi:biotin/lipoyl-containing protein [Lactococcus lactis]|uniref:biotin/lipoyl-containing protein n=1 Tax=Lactococcus lactis TaxID=1358 RepID=UPI001179FA28|nr:biotin/lipoyl-containing protein [Lactococcus lactis]TRW68987.1 hypothetical protein FNJ58_09765 [Lactococcus lactis]
MNNWEFIERNVWEEIPSKFVANSVAVLYEKMKLPNYFVYLSRIVGIIHLEVPFKERYYCKGAPLFYIESLKIKNEMLMEGDGIVEDILVEDGQIVTFDTPILIVKIES